MLKFAQQEWKRFWSEPVRFLLLLAPIVATSLCLLVYSERVLRDIPCGVIDLDQSALSRSLVRNLQATPQINLRTYPDEASVREAFPRGEIRGAILIPHGLDEDVREGRTARVIGLRDASNPVVANQVYSAIAGVIGAEAARLSTTRMMALGENVNRAKELAVPLRLDSRPIGNPYFDYLRNLAPGLLPIFLQMCLMLAGGTLLPLGWRASPSPRREALGRMIPWLLFALLASGVMFGILLPWWGIPVANTAGLLGLLLLLNVTSLSLGVAFGRFIRSGAQTVQVLLAFNTPAFLLSGYTFPEWAMPPVVEGLTRPLPFSLFLDVWRGVSGETSERVWIGLVGLGLYLLCALVVLAWPGPKENAHTSCGPALDPRQGGDDKIGGDEKIGGDDKNIGNEIEIVKNEFKRIFALPGLASLVLVAPLAYLVLYGGVYAEKEECELPMAVNGSASSSLTRELVRNLDAHPRLQCYGGSPKATLHFPENMKMGVTLALEIPAIRFLPAGDMQRAIGDVLNAKGAVIRRDYYMSRGFSPKFAEERANPLVFEDVPLFNPGETYGDYMLPPLGILILHQLLLISIAFATASSKGQDGSLWKRGLLYASWKCFWVMLWLTLGLSIFNVPNQANWIPLFLLSILGVGAVAALGILLGHLFHHGRSVLLLLAFSSYPVFFMSGASWPREGFPVVIDVLSLALPLRPWLAGMDRSFRMGAGLSQIQPELVHLGILLCSYVVLVSIFHLCKQASIPHNSPSRTPAP